MRLTIHRLDDWGTNEVFVLREDLVPVACGGNKARIVLKLIEDARSRGADAIVGYGNRRSNMCRVLSMLCAREGMPCTVVSPSDDGGARVETANSRIVRLCGAEVVACEKGSGVATVISGVMDRLSDAGRRPYYIFGDCRGVGNERVLSSAYEEVASAVCEWELEHGMAFDRVVVAVGTGSTYAGLVNGFRARSRDAAVTGFTIARGKDACAEALSRFTDRPVDIRDDALSGGYGDAPQEERRFLVDAMARYSVLFDPVYSGKALWGLNRLAAGGGIRGERVLFVHTGSLPLAIDGLEGLDG